MAMRIGKKEDGYEDWVRKKMAMRIGNKENGLRIGRKKMAMRIRKKEDGYKDWEERNNSQGGELASPIFLHAYTTLDTVDL